MMKRKGGEMVRCGEEKEFDVMLETSVFPDSSTFEALVDCLRIACAVLETTRHPVID